MGCDYCTVHYQTIKTGTEKSADGLDNLDKSRRMLHYWLYLKGGEFLCRSYEMHLVPKADKFNYCLSCGQEKSNSGAKGKMAYTMSHDTTSKAVEGTSRIRQMRARDSPTVAKVCVCVAYR